jgi:phage tail-like protein
MLKWQYRIRIKGLAEQHDFILPDKGLFIGSDPPQNEPYVKIEAEHIKAEHLHFEIEQDPQNQDDIKVRVTIQKVGDGKSNIKHNDDQECLEWGETKLLDPCRQENYLTIIDSSNRYSEIKIIVERIDAFSQSHGQSQDLQQPISKRRDEFALIPGLHPYNTRLLRLLPEIFQPNVLPEEREYHPAETFFARFLAGFDETLLPIEWTIGNFDLYLNPYTAPLDFLPWLEGWFALEPWSDEKARRRFLAAAYEIFSWRGTKHGLAQLLEAYLGGGSTTTIEDNNDDDQLAPCMFRVKVTLSGDKLQQRDIIKRKVKELIDAYKPLHTTYELYVTIQPPAPI